MKKLSNLNAVQNAVKELGEIQRELNLTKSALEEQIANLQAKYAESLDSLSSKEEELIEQITDFCNRNYSEIFKNGSKTAKFLTGEISVRKKPNSLFVENLELALNTLKKLNLSHLIKVKEDLNKAAIMATPDIIEKIDGLKLNTGLESLTIKPYQALK